VERLKNWLDSLRFDFVTRRWYFFSFSAACVALSWLLFFAIGPNWGIDFTGGTEIRMKFDKPVETEEVRRAIASIGLEGDAVQQIGRAEDAEFSIRVQDPEFGMKELASNVRSQLEAHYGAGWITEMTTNAEVGARFTITHSGDMVQTDEVKAALASIEGVGVQPGRDRNEFLVIVPGLSKMVEAEIGKALGDRQFHVLSVDAVGPKVGADLKVSSFIAMFAALGLILVYTAFRFDFAYGPGAIIALFHDISLPIGIFTVMRLPFDLGLIGALLTILGYSINDTIVIYDRIRENRDKHRRSNLTELVNLSINETLTRTFSTSFTVIVAVSAFLFLGGPVLFSFAFAMLLGCIFGSYSTIFIASPMVILLEDMKPWATKWLIPKAPIEQMAHNLEPASPPIGRPVEPAPPPAPSTETAVAPTGPQPPAAGMTESEKRRRERQEAERKHSRQG
jgi:preprotein translocase subunit SecF